MTLGFLVERVRRGSVLSAAEVRILVEEIDRLSAKLEGCTQEVARREEVDKTRHVEHVARADRLRGLADEVERVRSALVHEQQRRETQLAERDKRIEELTGILRDIGYGLLYQPEHSREELAGVIDREVGSHPKPLG